jgi:hypothetical protein
MTVRDLADCLENLQLPGKPCAIEKKNVTIFKRSDYLLNLNPA